MNEAKKNVDQIIKEIEEGEKDFLMGWNEIKKLKEMYVNQKGFESAEQSWHSFIGRKFQKMVVKCKKAAKYLWVSHACYFHP